MVRQARVRASGAESPAPQGAPPPGSSAARPRRPAAHIGSPSNPASTLLQSCLAGLLADAGNNKRSDDRRLHRCARPVFDDLAAHSGPDAVLRTDGQGHHVRVRAATRPWPNAAPAHRPPNHHEVMRAERETSHMPSFLTSPPGQAPAREGLQPGRQGYMPGPRTTRRRPPACGPHSPRCPEPSRECRSQPDGSSDGGARRWRESGGRFRKYRSSASEGERNSTVENPAFLSFSSNAAGSKLLIHGSPTEAAEREPRRGVPWRRVRQHDLASRRERARQQSASSIASPIRYIVAEPGEERRRFQGDAVPLKSVAERIPFEVDRGEPRVLRHREAGHRDAEPFTSCVAA